MLDFDCPLLGGLWNKLFLLRQAPACPYLATWRPSVQVWTECANPCLTWDPAVALIAPGLQETRSQPLLDGALPNGPHCSPGHPLLPDHPGAPAWELGSGGGTVLRTCLALLSPTACTAAPGEKRACEFGNRPWLAAQQGGVGQIRGPAPNLACWVLQGSEQLIMNLIKGSRSLNPIWGFL